MDPADGRGHGEAVGTGVRIDLDAGHLGVRADDRACPGSAEGKERRREDRVGMALRGTVRGTGQVVGEVRGEVAELRAR